MTKSSPHDQKIAAQLRPVGFSHEDLVRVLRPGIAAMEANSRELEQVLAPIRLLVSDSFGTFTRALNGIRLDLCLTGEEYIGPSLLLRERPLALPEVIVPKVHYASPSVTEPATDLKQKAWSGYDGFDVRHMPEALELFEKGYCLSRGGGGCHSIAAFIVRRHGVTRSRNEAMRGNMVLGHSEDAACKRLAKKIKEHFRNMGLL